MSNPQQTIIDPVNQTLPSSLESNQTNKTSKTEIINNSVSQTPTQESSQPTATHTLESNDNNRSKEEKTVKNKENAKKLWWSFLFDKRLIVVSIVLAVLFANIIGKNASFVVLSFLFGLSIGAISVVSLVCLVVKFKFLKYFVKLDEQQADLSSPNVTATSNSTNNSDSSPQTQQLHSLLIQTAIMKENKNFDGVYKVDFIVI
jgi:ABC-type nickel/cobalt efflux system permease component RcnA